MDSLNICLDEEEKNALLCGICFELYDTEFRTPKFLQCHHTCCLNCLKGLLKYQRLDCPFCRNTTIVNDINQLITNFYILPKVQKVDVLRKRLENLQSKAKDNWNKSKSMREDVVLKFKAADQACRRLKNMISKMYEVNSMKIDTLKEIIESPTEDLVDEVLSMKTSEFEMAVEESQCELENATNLRDAFEDLENFTYSVILKDHTGQKFTIDAMHDVPITFELADDKHNTYADAIQPVLSYILFQLKNTASLRRLEKDKPPSVRRTRSTSGSWNVHFSN